MATRYYRMSSLLAAEALLRRLSAELGIFPSRPLGYAHRNIVRIDYDSDLSPDVVVREVDPMARIVAKPTERLDLGAG